MPLAAAVVGVGVVGAVSSANAQKSAAKKAANAQRDASDAQIALQREQLARAENVAAPYRAAGANADAALNARWGGSQAAAVDPYGAWGSALNTRAGSVYDAGAPTSAWTPQRAPQVSRPQMPTLPQAQAPTIQPQPISTGWNWRSVNSATLPPMPRTLDQTGGQTGQQNPQIPTDPYGFGGGRDGWRYLNMHMA